MGNKICSLFGHRDFGRNESVKEMLKLEIVNAIKNYGVNTFYLGGKGMFDEFCAEIIKEVKSEYKIKSFLILAYLNVKMDEFDKRKIEELYDGTIFPPIEKVPLKFAISKRNQWMVSQSSICLFYLDYTWGGAYSTYKFAISKWIAAVPLSSASEQAVM